MHAPTHHTAAVTAAFFALALYPPPPPQSLLAFFTLALYAGSIEHGVAAVEPDTFLGGWARADFSV